MRQPRGDGVSTVIECPWKDEDRVDAAHLGIHGNRLRTAGPGVEQRPASRQAAGERYRPGQRMPDQRHGDLVARALQHRKDAGRHPEPLDGANHRSSRELGRGGMRRVRLDDYRAPGGQRRRRVCAGHRERQREVAGAEDRHRANRDQHAPNVRPRRPLIGIGSIDTGVDPRAVARQRGEQPQLPGRAGTLTGQPLGDWQRRLGVGHRDKIVADRLDLHGDLLEQVCPQVGRPAFGSRGRRGPPPRAPRRCARATPRRRDQADQQLRNGRRLSPPGCLQSDSCRQAISKSSRRADHLTQTSRRDIPHARIMKRRTDRTPSDHGHVGHGIAAHLRVHPIHRGRAGAVERAPVRAAPVEVAGDLG